jgi:hypothetical protein
VRADIELHQETEDRQANESQCDPSQVASVGVEPIPSGESGGPAEVSRRVRDRHFTNRDREPGFLSLALLRRVRRPIAAAGKIALAQRRVPLDRH